MRARTVSAGGFAALSRAAWVSASRHYDRDGRCIPGLGQAKAGNARADRVPRKPGLKLSLWDGIIPLGENRGGTPSSVRAPKGRAPHRKMRRWLPCVCRRSASFIYFVARVEQSETRERRRSRTFVPGFRCAQSGLQGETRVSEDQSQAPPLTFSKPSRVRHPNRASPARRGMRRRMLFSQLSLSQLPLSQQCLVTKLESAHSQKR